MEYAKLILSNKDALTRYQQSLKEGVETKKREVNRQLAEMDLQY